MAAKGRKMNERHRCRLVPAAAGVVLLALVTAGCGGSKFKWTDDEAAWSPDGKTIAFVSNRARPDTDHFQLYEMKADGSSVRRLKRSSGASYPSFSPNGRNIVYSSDPDLDLIGRDGRGQRTLTSLVDPTVPATWSPDGRWIAFVRRSDLWVIRLNGRRERRVAKEIDAIVYRPAASWSPNGLRLAFGCHGGDVCVVGVRGRPRRLTHESGGANTAAGFPSWSPDGTRIAFVRSTYGPFEGDEKDEACTIGSDGRDEHCWPAGDQAALAWLTGRPPLLAVSGPAGRIYLARADGSGRRFLRASGPKSDPYLHDEFDSEPAASPDGRRLLFGRYGPVPEGDVPQPEELVVVGLPRGHVEAATQATK